MTRYEDVKVSSELVAALKGAGLLDAGMLADAISRKWTGQIEAERLAVNLFQNGIDCDVVIALASAREVGREEVVILLSQLAKQLRLSSLEEQHRDRLWLWSAFAAMMTWVDLSERDQMLLAEEAYVLLNQPIELKEFTLSSYFDITPAERASGFPTWGEWGGGVPRGVAVVRAFEKLSRDLGISGQAPSP